MALPSAVRGPRHNPTPPVGGIHNASGGPKSPAWPASEWSGPRRSAAPGLGHDLRGEVIGALLDALAELETLECQHLATPGPEQFLNALIGILDEGLSEQGDLRQKLAQPATDHLLEDILGLAGFPGLSQKNIPFLVQDLRGNIVAPDELGSAGGHVHGQIPGQLAITLG